jgi:hypothetical protein
MRKAQIEITYQTPSSPSPPVWDDQGGSGKESTAEADAYHQMIPTSVI